MLESLPLVSVLVGLGLYTVLGGADFGAGFWQLFAGRGRHAERVREHAHHSMAPVWEANHVWLIFVLTVFWTAYPKAFGSIASTLAVPLFIAVLGSAYLAAVYLAADAARGRQRELEQDFRLRALAAGVVAGAVAVAGIFIVNADNHELFNSLLTGRALPAVIVSALAGVATLVLVYGRRYEPARYGAALAVAAIVAGWALARWPTILPGLSVDQAAAGHDTLVAINVAVLGGGAILFPALALLLRLAGTGRFAAAETMPAEVGTHALRAGRPRFLARSAIGCLIAGFGLLNVADAGWAHAVGVACLFGFVVLAFRAIVVPAVAAHAAK